MLGLRCGLAVDQLFNALGLQIRLDQHRLRLRERGLGSIAFHLEADRVDAIEHVPGLHVGSLLERTFHHNSRNVTMLTCGGAAVAVACGSSHAQRPNNIQARTAQDGLVGIFIRLLLHIVLCAQRSLRITKRPEGEAASPFVTLRCT